MKLATRWAFAAAAVIVWGAITHTSSAYEIQLNLNQRYQTIEGWGASTTIDDPRARQSYADLGMNILRVYMSKDVLVAGPNDYATPVELGADLNSNIQMMNFGAVSGAGNLAAWLKSNALEPDRVRISGSVWSPPHWMKGPTGQTQSWVGNWGNSVGTTAFQTPWLSNQCNGWYNQGEPVTDNQPGNAHFIGYSGDSIGGRLKTEDPWTVQQYGRYMAAWVKGFEQNFGAPMYAISIQNESSFENPFDSMNMTIGPDGQTDYAQYARSLAAVRDAWQQYGLTTKIKGPHMGNIGPTPQNPWALLTQMGMINAVKNYVDPVSGQPDPSLLAFMDYYNSNYYMGVDEDAVKATAGYYHGTAAVPAAWGSDWGVNISSPGVAQDGKPIWYSETGDGGPNWLDGPGNPGAGAITVALKIHNALVYSNASAYTYWSYLSASADADTYSLLGQNQLDDPELSKKYDAFKQFSRYIRPGAQRVDASFVENGSSLIGGSSDYDTLHSIDISAYINDIDHTLTLVLLNLQSTDGAMTLNLPAGLESLIAFRTSETENFAQVTDLLFQNDQVSFTLPAYSVMTLTGTLVPEPGALVLLLAPALLLVRRRRQ